MCTTRARPSSHPDPRKRSRRTWPGCTPPGSGQRCSTSHESARLMNPWKRKGNAIVGEMDRQEAAVLRGLVAQIEDMLRSRAAEAPEDELAELTGIRTGPSTAPEDPILSRLLPDFHRL